MLSQNSDVLPRVWSETKRQSWQGSHLFTAMDRWKARRTQHSYPHRRHDRWLLLFWGPQSSLFRQHEHAVDVAKLSKVLEGRVAVHLNTQPGFQLLHHTWSVINDQTNLADVQHILWPKVLSRFGWQLFPINGSFYDPPCHGHDHGGGGGDRHRRVETRNVGSLSPYRYRLEQE